MKSVLIPNDLLYRAERSRNGLRMAHALAKNPPVAGITASSWSMRCSSRRTQERRHGRSDLKHLLKRGPSSAADSLLPRRICMDARGMTEPGLME